MGGTGLPRGGLSSLSQKTCKLELMGVTVPAEETPMGYGTVAILTGALGQLYPPNL